MTWPNLRLRILWWHLDFWTTYVAPGHEEHWVAWRWNKNAKTIWKWWRIADVSEV